jgi:predicted dehydrogenase
MKMGVVGWGEIGQTHASLFESAGAQLCGVVSSKTHLSLGVPVYPRLEDMLPTVDAVTIAVPNYHHAQLCLKAIDAGKAVMVEKPLCIRREELCQLEARVAVLKAPVHVGYRLRFNPTVRLIKERLISPRRIECTYRMGIDRLADGKDWTRSYAKTGGSFFSLGIHVLDLCRWLAGAGTQRLANLVSTAADMDHSADYPLNVSMSGVLPNDVKLVANADLRGAHPPTIEISVDCDCFCGRKYAIRESVRAEDEKIEYGRLIAAFVDAARKKTVNRDYLAEGLVTHLDLMKARDMTHQHLCEFL